jgi:hypothetical protein
MDGWLDKEKVVKVMYQDVIHQRLIDWVDSKKQGAGNDVSGSDISAVDKLGE